MYLPSNLTRLKELYSPLESPQVTFNDLAPKLRGLENLKTYLLNPKKSEHVLMTKTEKLLTSVKNTIRATQSEKRVKENFQTPSSLCFHPYLFIDHPRYQRTNDKRDSLEGKFRFRKICGLRANAKDDQYQLNDLYDGTLRKVLRRLKKRESL